MREAIKSAAPCRRVGQSANAKTLAQTLAWNFACKTPEGFNPPPPPGGPAHCAGQRAIWICFGPFSHAVFRMLPGRAFGQIRATFWIPRGALGRAGGPQKSIFGEKAVRAQRFFSDFGGKAQETVKK